MHAPRGRHGVGCLAIALLLAQVHALPCRRSDVCSLGQLQPYLGDITTNHGLHAAAAARSWKHELILMATDARRLLPSVHAVANLMKLGMEHVLMLSTDARECQLVAKKLPRIGCSWSSLQPIPVPYKFLRMAPLWHFRWRTLARLIRMSHNVLLIDSDVTLYDDPYRYFKSPPFNQFTILNQPELLYHQNEYSDNKAPNGGIVYVQNASPSGPAAWLVAEVSHRLLRWIDDEYKLLQSRGMNTWCCYMDQDCFADGLSSVQAGRPLWQWSFQTCIDQASKDQAKAKLNAISTASQELVQGAWNITEHALPHWMHSTAGSNTTSIKWFTMKQPTAQGSWPKKLGGNLYPPPGNLTAQFLAELKEATSVPLWPDPEDSSPEAVKRALATPTERFMYFPPFLVSGYNPRGRLGYWNPAITGGAVQQVIAHTHYLPETDTSISKSVVKMLHTQYDYTAAEQLTQEGLYFKDQGAAHPLTTDQMVEKEATGRFVALHPRIHLNATRSWQELQQVLIGLAQVGSLMERTVLWPDLPCNTSWIVDGVQGGHQLPLAIRPDWMPWSPSPEALSCTWMHSLKEGCLFAGRGMLSVEWRHYTQRYGLQRYLHPARWNTVFFPSRTFFQVNASSSPSESVIVLREEDVLAVGRNHSLDPVVFIAIPVQVLSTSQNLPSAGSVKYRQRYGTCPILSRTAMERLVEAEVLAGDASPAQTRYLQAKVVSGKLVSAGSTMRAEAHQPPDVMADPVVQAGGEAGFDLEQEAEMLAQAEAEAARKQAGAGARQRARAVPTAT